ncbi:MAG: uroporphyrinogen decarboxylase family protein [Candidatus Sumerlaeia bacterium]|nr:uroporphyrinogen decarboxylase family protein [Candidatus Sumerlaeia bacterium]
MATGRERINKAMQRQQPDRVPVWCQLSLEHIIRNTSPPGEFPQFIEDYIRAECELTRRYGFDGMLLYLPGVREGTRIDLFLKNWIFTVPKGDPDHNFATADPERWEQEIPEYEAPDFYSSHLAREILGPDYHLGGWIPDAFSRAVQWFPSMEEALMAMVTDTERFKALVTFFEPQCIASAKAQIRLGKLESIHISSPYAGSSFISLNTYKNLVLPQLTRLAEALKPEPAFVYVHTCGFLSDRLELVASSGVDGIECLDPPPLGNVELSEAKRRIGDKVFLKGNLDSVNVLLYGTDEEVDRAITNCLKAGMPDGGYILSTACSVAPAVPPERVQRIAELAERFGYYEK